MESTDLDSLVLRTANEWLQAGTPACLVTVARTGRPSCSTPAPGGAVERTRLLTTGGAILRQAPECIAPHREAERLVACFAPAARLVVLGAGDTAFHEGQIALGVGFDIVWCEPR